MLQGSLAETTRTCGTPGCRCHRGERHGPHTYLSFKTPEGRSIVEFVEKHHGGATGPQNPQMEFVPFTAQTRTSGVRTKDGTLVLKGAIDAIGIAEGVQDDHIRSRIG